MRILARLLLIAVLAAALSGCVGDKAEFVHSVWRPADGRPVVSTVYYVTDREPDRAWPGGFAKHWADKPSCGTVEATIPAANPPGQPIPTGTVKALTVLDCGNALSGIVKQMAAAARARNCNEVLLYVHGFNTLFDGAALRAAQLAGDTQSGCLAAIFDWSSEGELGRYIPDIEHSGYAVPLLAQFLSALAGTQLRVDIIGHSMGGRVVLGALSALSVRADPPPAGFVSELLLAAADVGADPVNNDFAHLLHDAAPFARRVTVYASHGDAVLAVSAVAHGDVARAGSMPWRDRMLEGSHGDHDVDVVDASDAPAETLGHSYFGLSYEAVSDMALALRGVPVERRLEPDGAWPPTLFCKPARGADRCDPKLPHYVLKVADARKPDFFLRLLRRLATLVPRLELAPLTGSPDE